MAQDSPVGILHAFLYGPVKYVWRMTVAAGDLPAAKQTLQDHAKCWLEQISTAGLAAGKTLNADYFLHYSGSLVGKELKLICQTAATAFRPMVKQGIMSEDVWRIWCAIGDLGALIYQPSIAAECEDCYFVSLTLSRSKTST